MESVGRPHRAFRRELGGELYSPGGECTDDGDGHGHVRTQSADLHGFAGILAIGSEQGDRHGFLHRLHRLHPQRLPHVWAATPIFPTGYGAADSSAMMSQPVGMRDCGRGRGLMLNVRKNRL